MARPTKWTKELEQQMMLLLEVGNTRRATYTACGIHADTFAAWMLKDPSDRRKADMSLSFRDAVKQAEAKAEGHMVASVLAHTKKSPTAAMFWLERRRPDDWKERKEVSVDLGRLTEEELDELERIRKAANARGN